MAEEDLELAAVERQERLRALRAAVELVEPEENQDQQQDRDDEEDGEREDKLEDEIKFRNYIPRDKELQTNKVIPPSLPKFDDPVADAPIVNTAEDPFVSIAPKKANWDLRRDVSKKLDKLERRTQRALIELMQEEEEKRRQELAEADGEVHEE